MSKEKLYAKYSKEFGVKNLVRGKRNKFADVVANRTFEETYSIYHRNRNLNKDEIKDLVLKELRTEFTGVWAVIQWLIWFHRIMIFIQFVLQEVEKSE